MSRIVSTRSTLSQSGQMCIGSNKWGIVQTYSKSGWHCSRSRQNEGNKRSTDTNQCEIEKLRRVGFIRPMKKETWLNPIVVGPKKNGNIWVCVDYRKLNAATIRDAFSSLFTNGILDVVVDHEIYSFVDVFSGYNHVRMNLEDE